MAGVALLTPEETARERERLNIGDDAIEKEQMHLLFPENTHRFALMGGLEGVSKALDSDLVHGIDPASIPDRVERWGNNEVRNVNERSFWYHLFASLLDFSLVMLVVAAAASLTLGLSIQAFADDTGQGYVEGVAILTAVAVIVCITAINEHRKDLQFRKLFRLHEDRLILVKRANTVAPTQVSSLDVVVGDILFVETGDVLPVDGIFLGGTNFKVNELHVTGEADDIRKTRASPFTMRGSHVVEGVARLLVVAVGEWTYLRHKEQTTRAEPSEDTELQKELGRLAKFIGKFGIAMAILLFVVLSTKYLITRVVKAEDVGEEAVERLVEYCLLAMAVVAVAVPEGLPFSVTLAIAFSIKYMVNDANVVKNLDAVENMGRCTEVLIDLTGTITRNWMVLSEGYVAGTSFRVDDPHAFDYATLEKRWQSLGGSGRDSVLFKLVHGLALNSTAHLVVPNAEWMEKRTQEQMDEDDDLMLVDGVVKRWHGMETEIALLKFAQNMPYYGDVQTLRDQGLDKEVHLFPFDPNRKWSAYLCKLDTPLTDSFFDSNQSSSSSSSSSSLSSDAPPKETYRLYCKGGAEVLLGYCTTIIDSRGDVVDIRPYQDRLRETLRKWTHHGLRTLCLAYQDMYYRPHYDISAEDISEMTCIGIVGIRDTIRPSIAQSIRHAQDAGVRVRLVTGENETAAISIARRVGIFNPEYHISMDSTQFGNLTNDELKVALPNMMVLARATPFDKERLVRRLQEDFHAIVAVTGDGIDDAHALKTADVGFALGASGTEVAKDSADIVLLDDNFDSIVQAIKWGRNVFFSIRKFLQYQLTVNIVAVIITMAGSVSNDRGESPISPVGLLWVNLIMDTFGALALATDIPSAELLNRTPPVRRDAPLVTRVMKLHIVAQAAYQLLFLLLALYIGPAFYSVERYERKHFTIVFNMLVVMTLFNLFNVRSVFQSFNIISGLERNWYFWTVFCCSFGFQVLIVFLGGNWVKTEPITGGQWASCFVAGAGSLLVGSVLRSIPPKGLLLDYTDIRDTPAERAEWKHTLNRKTMREKILIAFRVTN